MGLVPIIPAAISIGELWPIVMEKVGVISTHTWHRRTILYTVKHRLVVLKASVKWFWFDTQQLPNIGDHAALLLQHDVWHSIIHQSLEHRDVHMVWWTLESLYVAGSLQLLMITDKNQMLQ